MAILGNTLYVADTDNNQLRTAGYSDASFAPGLASPSPASPCTDSQRHLVWVLSAHKNNNAEGDNGKIPYQFPFPVTCSQTNAAKGTRLEVLSYETDKVNIFD